MLNSNNFMNKTNPKAQQGFTLVELVIVVVILGFLAVTAIPKFIDLTDQAKQANIEGMAGGFATGVSLTRAQWEAEGRPQISDDNSVNYDGSVLYLTTPAAGNELLRPGYPMGTGTAALGSGTMNDGRCEQVWNGILAQPPVITNSITTLNNEEGSKYYVDVETGTGANNGNTICAFYLKESLDKDTDGSFLAPADTSDGYNFTYDPASSAVVVTINND